MSGGMAASNSDFRIVLLGKTGSGKSSAGNTILGEEKFHANISPESVTKKCEKHETTVFSRKISVIDTPGIIDKPLSKKDLKALELSIPGPHVFLLVIRLGRFTEEERNTVDWIQKNFGEDALKHTIVLFTHADQLDKPIDQYIKQSEQLNNLVQSCEGGYHSFNNRNPGDRSQVQELVDKIDVLVRKYYIYDMEKKRKEEEKRRIKKREEQIREDERKKIQREKMEMQAKLRQSEETNRRLKEQLDKVRPETTQRRSGRTGESRITIDRESLEVTKDCLIYFGLPLLAMAGGGLLALGIAAPILENNLAALAAIPVGLLFILIPAIHCFCKRTRAEERLPLLNGS